MVYKRIYKKKTFKRSRRPRKTVKRMIRKRKIAKFRSSVKKIVTRMAETKYLLHNPVREAILFPKLIDEVPPNSDATGYMES